MNLGEYLDTFNKDNCPVNCDLKNYQKMGIIAVPPPEEIIGIIISRDPTVDWLYTYLRNENDSYSSRNVLFASAIPLTLLTKIILFMSGRIDKKSEETLFDLIFHKTYWTHFHKCQTDVTNKISLEFKYKNAEKCANRWLINELFFAINDKTKFIITLGKDVQKWIEKWNKKSKNDITIIKLPHPSNNNNRIWYRSPNINQNSINNTESEIKKLIDFC